LITGLTVPEAGTSTRPGYPSSVQLIVPVFVMTKPLTIVPTATELRSNLMRR
jgi:hypothetical protein